MSHKKLLSWMISGEEHFHLEMIDVDLEMIGKDAISPATYRTTLQSIMNAKLIKQKF